MFPTKNSSVLRHKPGISNQWEFPSKPMSKSEPFKGKRVKQTLYKCVVGLQCICYFPCCCNKIPDQSNLRKGGLILADSFRVQSAVAGSHGGRCLKWLVTLCPVKKQRKMLLLLLLSLPSFDFIWDPPPPAGRMVPLTFKVGLSTSVKLIRLISMVILNPAKLVIKVNPHTPQ